MVFARRLLKIRGFPRKSVVRLVLNSVAQLAVQRAWGCPFVGAAESQDKVHWNCSEPAPRVIQTWVSMLCYRTRYHRKDSSSLVSMRPHNRCDSSRNQPAALAAYLNHRMHRSRACGRDCLLASQHSRPGDAGRSPTKIFLLARVANGD